MKRILAFFGGVLSGGAIGAAVALLFTPRSGDAMRDSLKDRYNQALEAGNQAAEQRRQALEAKLAEMTGSTPAEQPNK